MRVALGLPATATPRFVTLPSTDAPSVRGALPAVKVSRRWQQQQQHRHCKRGAAVSNVVAAVSQPRYLQRRQPAEGEACCSTTCAPETFCRSNWLSSRSNFRHRVRGSCTFSSAPRCASLHVASAVAHSSSSAVSRFPTLACTLHQQQEIRGSVRCWPWAYNGLAISRSSVYCCGLRSSKLVTTAAATASDPRTETTTGAPADDSVEQRRWRSRYRRGRRKGVPKRRRPPEQGDTGSSSSSSNSSKSSSSSSGGGHSYTAQALATMEQLLGEPEQKQQPSPGLRWYWGAAADYMSHVSNNVLLTKTQEKHLLHLLGMARPVTRLAQQLRARLGREATAKELAAHSALSEAEVGQLWGLGASVKHLLMRHNFRAVVGMAQRYRHTSAGVSQEDLLAAGLNGLSHAIDKFDVSRPTRLLTYALWWVRIFMQRALEGQSRLIALPVHLHPLLKRLLTQLRATGTPARALRHDAACAEAAAALGVPVKHIKSVAAALDLPTSLDAEAADRPSSRRPSGGTLMDVAADEEAGSLEEDYQEAAYADDVGRLLARLPLSERLVLSRTFLQHHNLGTTYNRAPPGGYALEEVLHTDTRGVAKIKRSALKHARQIISSGDVKLESMDT